MIFIVFLCLIYFEVTVKSILIIAISVTFKVKTNTNRIDIIIILGMIFPIHHFVIIRLLLTTVLSKHCAVGNESRTIR